MTLVFYSLAVLLPVILALLICLKKWRSGWLLLALITFTFTGTIHSGFQSPWYLYSYWLLLLICVIVVIATIIGLVKLKSVSWSKPPIVKLITTVLLFVGTAYFTNYAFNAIAATRPPPEVVEVDFPFKGGVYAVVQGGSKRPLQGPHASTPSQLYALDVVKIDKYGLTSAKYLSDDSSNDITLGEPVYSPCYGTVVWVRDGLPNKPVFKSKTPAGNALAIECKGIVIGFGHFETNTIAVELNQEVKSGQYLGKVGMSGNTKGPHLHFHAERGQWQGDFSDNPGVALTFKGKFLWSGRIIDMRE